MIDWFWLLVAFIAGMVIERVRRWLWLDWIRRKVEASE